MVRDQERSIMSPKGRLTWTRAWKTAFANAPMRCGPHMGAWTAKPSSTGLRPNGKCWQHRRRSSPANQIRTRSHGRPHVRRPPERSRGLDARIYPWGDQLNAGHYANFADARTTFAWREPAIDDGFAQSAPVGSYPRGASPFGIEDLSGNVFEWCADGFEPYRGKEVVNPRGSRTGVRRIYRGGSWKSRAASLRASARAFNAPNYSSNDVGFRIVCEPE